MNPLLPERSRFCCVMFFTLFCCLSVTHAFAQGFPPEQAVQRMTVADGFEVQLVASEPLVRQPVAIDFDDRGRLWVIQYLQYPNPAGLKRVQVDQHTRSQYDRVPKPPPHGPRGADRLTILEDTDHDGQFDKAHDFVNGLNLASGFALGNGGVYVLQAPYLLFYPDQNRDDKPDSDPEVLLKGFGLDDASAVANSLTWGPDGWLYGCQGSTVTARIRGIKFVQAIWRYHPRTKAFELFAEGGGNMWGLDFDRQGNLLASTNLGGFVLLHIVQEGYYWKQFSKHGPLRNPFTFGYFDHAPHQNFKGGHVTVGGTVYQGTSLPASLQGKYISGNLLGHEIQFHTLIPDGTSFRTQHGGTLVQANDSWFAPTDLTVGPDGAVYFTDWHDKRTAHPNPDADWDRSNGRIYRLQARDVKPAPFLQVHELESQQLLALLQQPNEWYVRAARRELITRLDPHVPAILKTQLHQQHSDHQTLQLLWTLASLDGLDEPTALHLLQHPAPAVRSWTIRLLGDRRAVSPTIAQRFIQLAQTDASPQVRSQLASTAARLPADPALEIAQSILKRNLDRNDPHIPLLLWWAIEKQALSTIDEIEQCFATPEAWQQPFVSEFILERLMKRYAAAATPRTLEVCQKLLTTAPNTKQNQLLQALETGLALSGQGQLKPDQIPTALAEQLVTRWRAHPDNLILMQLNARLGYSAVLLQALDVAVNDSQPLTQRTAMLKFLQQFGNETVIAPLLPLLQPAQPTILRQQAMLVLARYADPRISQALLKSYPDYDASSQTQARRVLFTRQPWALEFLRRVDQGKLPEANLDQQELTTLNSLGNKTITGLTAKHWGQINQSDSQHKITEIRRVRFLLKHPGNAQRGSQLFQKQCATCHQLFGTGNKLGPDLTTANRADLNYLLESIIDPSRFVRKEYVASVVITRDGRVVTGIIKVDQPDQIRIANNKNELTTIRRDDIEEIHDSPVSLMPENILKQLSEQELQDLFAYLQRPAPKKD